MSKFYAGFGLGLFMLLAMVLYQRSNCPCGFKYDAFSGGCQVDLNAGPCPGQGGGTPPPPGGSGGAGGDSAGSPPTPFHPTRCSARIVNCTQWPDWKGAEFVYGNFSGTVTTGTSTNFPVTLAISQQDDNGRSCTDIKGNIDVPVDTLIKIPFDARLTSIFPIATTSAGGPSKGLLAKIDPECRPVRAEMIVFPGRTDECGCKVSFKRD